MSDTRSSTWIVRERSWSSMAAWRKRPSAWAISITEVPWFSTASIRNPVLSSRIHFWMQERISSGERCSAAMRKTSSATFTSRSMPRRSTGRFSPPASSLRPPGEPRQKVLGLGDAVPAEVVDHPARDPREQVLIGLAQEIDDHPPVPARSGRQAIDRALPPLEPVEQLAVKQQLAEALGDRVDELPLLLEKRPLVGRGQVPDVEDLDASRDLALHADRSHLHPRRAVQPGRLVDHAVRRDPRLAVRGVLPARRQDPDDVAEDLIQRGLLPVADLVDAIEARQLLGALLQRVQNRVDNAR